LRVVSYGSEIVLELERSSFNEWPIGTARSEGEAGPTAQTNLTEEVVGDSRTFPGVVGANDERTRTVTHHHQIHQLTRVFAGTLRVKVD
jgi:hypothetical protein